jgi:pSer/pThr/pTyr-binding forkhead associated (FHA) protein
MEVSSSPGLKREILVAKDEFLIGRGADCDLRLQDTAISRHHCLLRVRSAEVTVNDLGSSNGTFVNGHRLRSTVPLHDGDELGVGPFHFRLESDNSEGISWGDDVQADPGSTTAKLKPPGRLLPEGGKGSD